MSASWLKRHKRSWLYYMLAAFNLLTISFSLYLNYRLMAIYTESVRVNMAWAERLNRYSDLADLAGAVDAPGNDVFDTQDVDKESRRLRKAVTDFNQAFYEALVELDGLHPRIEAELKSIRKVMNEMRAEAEGVFEHLRLNQRVKAGEKMAAMNRYYVEVNAAFVHLNERVREIQKAHFATQKASAASLARYEIGIALAIALMVVGITLYGRKLASAMMAAENELKSLNETLEQKVMARTAESNRLVKKLRILSSELLLTEERERRSLARDLHDDLGQMLALAKIKLANLDWSTDPACAQGQDALSEISQLIDQAEKQVRSLTFQLRPPILDQLGLVPAIQWLAEDMKQNYHLDVSVEGETDPIKFDDHVRYALFRSVRELLINAAKHAETDKVFVRFFWRLDSVRLEVEDQGQGFDASQFDPQSDTWGFGLFSVHERIDNLGGQFYIQSKPGEGTLITLGVPLLSVRKEVTET